MTMFGISFDGNGGSYGTFETIPSFGYGRQAFLLGSSLTSTPAVNIFDGSTAGNPTVQGTPGTVGLTGAGATVTASISGGVANVSVASGAAIGIGTAFFNTNGLILGVVTSLGTGTGGVGTYNLAAGSVTTASNTMYTASAYVDTGLYSATEYATNSALTYVALVKVSGTSREGLVSDYIGTSGPSLSLLTDNAGNLIAFARGTSSGVNSVVALPSNPSTTWTLCIAQFTATTFQASYWRTATGLVSSVASTIPTGVGSTVNKLRVGRPYSGPPSATVAAAGVYNGALTSSQIIQLGQRLSDILAGAGQTL